APTVLYSPPIQKKEADSIAMEKARPSEEIQEQGDAAHAIQPVVVEEQEASLQSEADIGRTDMEELRAVQIPQPVTTEGTEAVNESPAVPTVDDNATLEMAPAEIAVKGTTPQVKDKGTGAASETEVIDKTALYGDVPSPTNAEESRAALAEQTDMAQKILPVIMPSDSMIAIQRLPAETAKTKGPSTDAYMAMYDVDRQMTELSERGIDPDQFDELSPQDIATYINYYDKAQDVRQEYSSVISFYAAQNSSEAKRVFAISTPVGKETAQKPPADSMKIIIQKMANAFHNLGRVTPIDNERGQMLDYLRSLHNMADSGTQQEIDRYIGDLESETK
ncbi:MAG: hypothetical protein AB1746_10845, partial [Candidatus Zixiibacteriota bacterium]